MVDGRAGKGIAKAVAGFSGLAWNTSDGIGVLVNVIQVRRQPGNSSLDNDYAACFDNTAQVSIGQANRQIVVAITIVIHCRQRKTK